MATNRLDVAPVYLPLFNFEKRYVLLKSGRTSGKSVVGAQLVIACSYKFHDEDIIIARDSYSDLKDSIFSEVMSQVEKLGLTSLFKVRQNPLRVYQTKTNVNIYFIGIGGSDIHRTKSFKPINEKLSLCLFEECQQLKSQENLEQAHASFRRFLNVEHGTFLHLFNPEPQNFHWLNTYYKIKEHDPDWLCVHSSYKDVESFLNDLDLKEIAKMELTDINRYKWMYMGESTGGFGSVYPQFKPSKHIITMQQAIDKWNGLRFRGLIIGVDGAVTHDATVLTPIGLLENGQALVLPIFYHDPKKDGQKSSVELMPYVKMWWEELKAQYYIEPQIMCRVDSASTDLIRNLQYLFSNEWDVTKFTKPTIIEMVGVTQSALAKNMVYFLDIGGYKDYVTGEFIKGVSPLFEQLESLIWNEKQTGYDPIIPNDASDSFTYGINTYYKNPDNVYWLEVEKNRRHDFYDLDINGGN